MALLPTVSKVKTRFFWWNSPSMPRQNTFPYLATRLPVSQWFYATMAVWKANVSAFIWDQENLRMKSFRRLNRHRSLVFY
jgi:hypothetical protein